MKFAIIGDVVGLSGENVLFKFLSKRGDNYDFIIVNAENIDKGFGILPNNAKSMFNYGVDVITLGNHSFDKKEIYNYLDSEHRIIRPYNFSKNSPGKGYTIIKKNDVRIAVVSLQGKVYMNAVNCPFLAIDELYEEIGDKADIIIVDFHAEVTSEKNAMGWNLAGKASLVYGTHTHIQTADERILLNKTGYITDIGMTGGHDGVIGMNRKEIIKKFKDGMPVRYTVCEENKRINGIEVEIDTKTGKTLSIDRINLSYEKI
ncbi:TIGR00282 family metallophosphoesterase [Streptobacillus moniliformis]|uniref:Metallophosphoesterase n=1 Tax=Streptobacillus moniliformis (strain ATCC 14647 / DSM 12112 / NCTC 10651 / 9901) TaxID=519441 RepID=D1AYM5_STRM9|nr:TIGR00282 family metallophosphoesterase [Streptobacillus moniliformis]ACZ01401.1 metallophosphoesterase [Streptobacillus moniliformis DSM 12112]AVL43586.1 TIGR00282 family metallophosphoesterase [Streptobacillus moniliformis]QXW66088.1 TIGR00282 family metallophosphoesterase [Streptobacillus moniliformis]SQA13439.1 metallophosphoesterase, MG_246/BB_0505 family [Streptobacillus moniliformis]